MVNDTPSAAQQENLLALLCFDPESAPLVRNLVDVTLFDSDIYRSIADHAGKFLDRFGVPVGDHLPDLFDLELSEGTRKSSMYDRVIRGLYELQGGVNRDYVIQEMQKFVRQQQLKSAIVDAGQALQGGNVDRAEEIWRDALKTELKVFDPGIVFYKDSYTKVLSFLRNPTEFISTGIPYLDRIGVGPTRKELMTVLAATGKGKTWFLVHLGKRGLIQRKNVLHITLEMSEERLAQRYIQTLFSISRRGDAVDVPIFRTNKKGRFIDFDFKTIKRPSFSDGSIDVVLKKKLALWKNRFKLIVKEFPTNQLTFPQLQAYLDQLERSDRFIPDVIIIDYADIMKIDSSILRIDIGRVYKDLRGLAVERNIPIITASQTNRAGEDARIATLKYLGEDYSKAATSDVVLSYNQTSSEAKYNLGRLFTAKVRNEESGRTIILSQAYSMGQFYLSSAVMSDTYWDVIEDR